MCDFLEGLTIVFPTDSQLDSVAGIMVDQFSISQHVTAQSQSWFDCAEHDLMSGIVISSNHYQSSIVSWLLLVIPYYAKHCHPLLANFWTGLREEEIGRWLVHQ